MRRALASLVPIACFVASSFASAVEPIPPIPRVLPPQGIEIPAAERKQLQQGLERIQARLPDLAESPLVADAAVYVKAVDYALRHGEFFDAKDVAKAHDLLKQAGERLDELANGKHSWKELRGLVVRGYVSAVDGSPQPYGLVIPQNLDLARPAPLYVWLHGRGDKQTDLHFIHERQTRAGQIAPPGAIVLHPFGRHCLGFKSAGEIDVLEAVEHAKTQYKIDPRRIVLMGFSMGGAGAWHLGAHYTDRWTAVSPGAGFAETARYVRLKPENFPPAYEQALWGAYDVPHYVRNLFNLPVVAYSGELDKQKQAADVMAEAFESHGKKLTHIIGPGVEHKYEPKALADVLARLDAALKSVSEDTPKTVHLQTRTLRYGRQLWVEALGLESHWQDSRVDARITGKRQLAVTTKNIAVLRLSPFPDMAATEIEIDGQSVEAPFPRPPVLRTITLVKTGGEWSPYVRWQPERLSKTPGLQGPIDDAFLEPFLVVLPDGKSKHERVQRWVDFELEHFLARWRGVFRGEPRVKKTADLTTDDIQRYHLVAWGDPSSNRLLAMIASKLEPAWTTNTLVLGESTYTVDSHVPVLIRPNPLNPAKYLVVNSGPTFREAHDRTNSQQNPKLPDWAIVDLSQPPDAAAPGKIAAAGFYDEAWRVK